MDYDVVGLFPIPVMRSSLGRDLSKDEFACVVEHAENVVTNVGGCKVSANKRILDAPVMESLRKELIARVELFAFRVLQCAPTFSLRFTQSWLNYQHTGDSHAHHYHSNSFLSGVLYIQTGDEGESDRLTFVNERKRIFNPVNAENNQFNALTWWLPVTQGDIVLFPSHLPHLVMPYEHEATRISLAFNIFPVGVFGDYEDSSELII